MAFDGEMTVRTFESESADLVVLDLMMPKRSGMEVLKEIRRHSRVPVIILSGLGDEERLVTALDLGADDYLVKPFRPRELRARTHALLRRAKQIPDSEEKPAKSISLGALTLDPRTRQVTLEEKPLQLTSKEFALLHYLMLNRDIVLTVSDIISNVWGFESGENEEVVKVTIYRLRRKVEPNPSKPQYILNVPGQGYKFQFKTQDA
jgi:DNA-binding response OmpR family regulator